MSALLGLPFPVAEVRRLPEDGGVPEQPGFYAWWVQSGELDVESMPHPGDSLVKLLYVGIAPGYAKSRATLRSRVLKSHLGGNTGSSTFRFALASVLQGRMVFTPRRTPSKKIVLPADQNKMLSEWQREHLRLSWHVRTEPWEVEDTVIAELSPPLNSDANHDHPFYPQLAAARKAFRDSALEVE